MLRRRKASGGTSTGAAMGVIKPRTRHAAGPEAPRYAESAFRHVSQGEKVHERKHRPT